MNRAFALNLKESRVKKSIQIIQRISPKGRLLDVGCSTGEWALFWKNDGWESYGIDVNKENISQAEKKGIITKLCDLNSQQIPFADGYFDVIIAGEVIEHLVDTDRFVRDLFRCLKVGGYLLITTPNLVSLENRLRILFGFYPIWVDYKLANSGHVSPSATLRSWGGGRDTTSFHNPQCRNIFSTTNELEPIPDQHRDRAGGDP